MRAVRAFLAVLCVSLSTQVAPAAAQTACGAWTVESTPNPAVDDALLGVAITRHGHAWAVGGQWTDIYHGRPLIEHDDGVSWRVVPAPGDGVLSAVTVVPDSRQAWAVGASNQKTLTEHWNGSAWAVVPSPNPVGFSGMLQGVWAASAHDVWAVGTWGRYGDAFHSLTEHWNGSAWSIVPSPDLGPTFTDLSSVSGMSGNDVWAVGRSVVARRPQPVTEHWDGSAWTLGRGTFPASSQLFAVDMFSPASGWAVGTRDDEGHTFAARLVGGGWRTVATPNIGRHNELYGVTVTPSSNAWAVGQRGSRPLLLHWNGRAWSTFPSPPVPGTGGFRAVAVNSRTGAVWAVGAQVVQEHAQSLAESYCPA